MITPTTSAAVQRPLQAPAMRLGQAGPSVMVRPEASSKWCACVPRSSLKATWRFRCGTSPKQHVSFAPQPRPYSPRARAMPLCVRRPDPWGLSTFADMYAASRWTMNKAGLYAAGAHAIAPSHRWSPANMCGRHQGVVPPRSAGAAPQVFGMCRGCDGWCGVGGRVTSCGAFPCQSATFTGIGKVALVDILAYCSVGELLRVARTCKVLAAVRC